MDQQSLVVKSHLSLIDGKKKHADWHFDQQYRDQSYLSGVPLQGLMATSTMDRMHQWMLTFDVCKEREHRDQNPAVALGSII